jgi:hypothetical protein
MMTKLKINKLSAAVLMLLFVAYVVPLCLAAENAQQAAGPLVSGEGKYPDVPGAPDNAVQYNKTNETPIADMQQIQAGEPGLFQYRNMTMLMNCSQNCEVVFTSDPNVTPKVLALSIEPNQTMTLTMNMYRSPLQGEQVKECNLNFYLGIEPNAQLQLNAQIRLLINQTKLNQELGREVNIEQLSWMYWNQTRAQWQVVESFMDQNGYLVCNTDHFSTWTVAELADTTEPTAEPTQSGIPVEYLYIGAAVIAIVVVAVGVLAFKKHK